MTMFVKDVESMTFSASEQSLDPSEGQFAYSASTTVTVLYALINVHTFNLSNLKFRFQ